MASAETNTSVFAVRLLGGLEIRVNGAPLPIRHSRKEHLLVALLTLAHGQAVPRRQLAQTLWPEPDYSESNVLKYLRETVWALRQTLSSQSHRLVKTQPRGLHLNLSGALVDVVEFDAAIQANTPESLARAVSLYRGPLLDGDDELWISREREQRQLAYQQARLDLAVEARAIGAMELALDHLQKAIAEEPAWEPAQRALMQTLAEGGNYHGANQVYLALRDHLHRIWNTIPEQQTTDIWNAIRATARQAAIEPTWQRVSSPQTPQGNLPCPLTELVGRAKESREIEMRLERARLVTLTGAGGIGKTRQAIQVAELTREKYADGVWFVDLAPLSDGSWVAQAVASTLDLHEEQEQPMVDLLKTRLRHRSLLLILDNCEHLLESCARLARELLEACRQVRILATSRQRLGLTGEVTWRVPSLPAPYTLPHEDSRLVETLRGYAAVELFVERLQAVQPGFVVTAQNARTIARICHLLDGIPLALELAAARGSGLAVEELAALLNDRFRLLTHGDTTVPPRHQTLRATIDWSYDLLTEAERQLFQQLSVFRGGWTLEAAEEVCRDGTDSRRDVRTLLESLVDKSLILMEPREGQETRYRFLETIRAYSYERLVEALSPADLQRRHRDWCLALAEHAEPRLRGAEQMDWLRRLEAESDNLRATLDSTETEGDGAQSGVRLAGALGLYWLMRERFTEGRERLSAALQCAVPGAVRIKPLLVAGLLADYGGDSSRAADLIGEGVTLARQSGGAWLLGYGLSLLGFACRVIDPPRAVSCHQEALAIGRSIQDPWLLAQVLSTFGWHESYHGNVLEAKPLFEEGLTHAEQTGDRWMMGELILHKGHVACHERDFPSAQNLFRRSLQVTQQFRDQDYGDKRGIGATLHYLGHTLICLGDTAAARSAFEQSLAIGRDRYDIRIVSSSCEGLARIAGLEGRMECAACLFGAAAALRTSTHNPPLRIWRPDNEASLEAVRAALDASAFAAAWERGQTMSFEQTVQYAMAAIRSRSEPSQK